eukprot:TRINITY_DN32194_c0_g1_i2.p1 TRINITY_DN32194_c0_g1~~TRINITY_DN32194_c0_g1_i2.p1  ORF type:complete len:295 (-),score=49.49 TRINITY_DN32194_c0_g1_i2:160-1044(-)
MVKVVTIIKLLLALLPMIQASDEPRVTIAAENVADELQDLKDQLNQLLTEYAKTKGDLEEVTKDLGLVTSDVKVNHDAISSNEVEISKVSSDVKHVHSDVTALDHKLTDVKATDIGGLRSDFSAAKLELLKQLMPVGSIIAWVGPIISKGDLPGGWQLCDGSSIDGTPYYTPELNKSGRFLRGTTAQMSDWTYQEDMLRKHKHGINDPGHSHVDGGHTHGYHDELVNYNQEWDARIFHRGKWAKYYNYHKTSEVSHANIQTSKSGIEVLDAIASFAGEETRPKNMAVIWIMRVY